MQTTILARSNVASTMTAGKPIHQRYPSLVTCRVATAGRRSDELITYSFADTSSGTVLESVSEVSLVPGLQDFAASVWEQRQGATPGQADPLDFLFSEFDEDGDGSLTSVEISNALRSKGVEVLPRQVQKFIDDVDINKNGMVERNEFGNFIFRLAVADLKHMEDDDI